MLREPLKTVISKTITGTSSSSATGVIDVNDFDGAVAKLVVTTLSGTSPTLDIYLQTTDDGGTTWFDVVHFPQQSAATTYPVWMPVYVKPEDGTDSVLGGEIGDASISAGKTGVPLMSKSYRLKYVYGGTVGAANWTFELKLNSQDGATR